MKIISLYQTTPGLDIDIHPDSTMILPGRPLFLPDEGTPMQAKAHVAVRISRLGKNIATKFASRYYDGVTVGLRIVPASGLDLTPGVISAMDNSSVMSEWRDVTLADAGFVAEIDGTEIEIGIIRPQIDAAIHEVGRYMTLKMGDILLLPAFAETSALLPSSRLSVKIDGGSVLDMKII